MVRRKRSLLIATIVYALFVVGMTLGPQPIDDRQGSVLRTVLAWLASMPATAWLDYSVVEFLGNIFLFVPLGMLGAGLAGRSRWWLVLSLALAFTLTIEFIQLGLPGRVSDPRDLFANTLGAGIGIVVVALLTRGRSRRKEDGNNIRAARVDTDIHANA